MVVCWRSETDGSPLKLAGIRVLIAGIAHNENQAKMDSEPLKRAAGPQTDWLTPGRFAALLALLILAAFPKVALGLHSFVYRDYGVLGYPFIHYARESFWRGELPLWNPLSNCGAPFLGQWGTMTLYPFSF